MPERLPTPTSPSHAWRRGSLPLPFMGPPDVKLISLRVRHHPAAPPGSGAELEPTPQEARNFFAQKEQPEHSAISSKPSTDSPFIRFDLPRRGRHS